MRDQPRTCVTSHGSLRDQPQTHAAGVRQRFGRLEGGGDRGGGEGRGPGLSAAKLPQSANEKGEDMISTRKEGGGFAAREATKCLCRSWGLLEPKTPL